jgi:hypothetical protein
MSQDRLTINLCTCEGRKVREIGTHLLHVVTRRDGILRQSSLINAQRVEVQLHAENVGCGHRSTGDNVLCCRSEWLESKKSERSYHPICSIILTRQHIRPRSPDISAFIPVAKQAFCPFSSTAPTVHVYTAFAGSAVSVCWSPFRSD